MKRKAIKALLWLATCWTK